jgi:hypothetical protein
LKPQWKYGVLQRDVGGFLRARFRQAVRWRGEVRDGLGRAVEQQAGTQPSSEHHRDPRERAEVGLGVVGAEPDAPPGMDDQEHAERQRAERDEDEDPAEVPEDPPEDIAHDVAQALRT